MCEEITDGVELAWLVVKASFRGHFHLARPGLIYLFNGIGTSSGKAQFSGWESGCER